jgi:hypothetical protein
MSFYATIQGSICYKNEADYEAAKAILVNGGWLNADGFILDETDNPINESGVPNVEPHSISIPYSLHRNLTRVLDQLFVGGKGTVVWTSTDGCFSGGVIVDGNETTYDLAQWAKENVEEPAPNADDDFDDYCEWLAEVEDEFQQEMI